MSVSSRTRALSAGLAGILLAALLVAWLLERVAPPPTPQEPPPRPEVTQHRQPLPLAERNRPVALPVPEPHRRDGHPTPPAVPAPHAPVPAAPATPTEPTGGFGAPAAPSSPARERFPLAKEGIQAAIRSKVPEIGECYESWLQQSPGLGGRLKVGFTIAANDAGGGSVTGIEILDGGMGHTFMEGCVLNAFNEIEFDAPEGGPLRVTYPLAFSPGDAGP